MRLDTIVRVTLDLTLEKALRLPLNLPWPLLIIKRRIQARVKAKANCLEAKKR